MASAGPLAWLQVLLVPDPRPRPRRATRQYPPVSSRSPLRTFLCWVTAITAGIAASVLFLWVLPAWLTLHPHLEGAERHTAITATRVGIVAYLVTLGAGGTLFFTARTYGLTKTGQVTDRYT